MKNLMVILERYIGVAGPRIRIGGFVTRDVAHYHGVPHGAVQVGIVALSNGVPHLLLHKRSRFKKTSPNTWDFCGGHIDAATDLLTNFAAWDDQSLISRTFDETAIREANEELKIIKHPDFRFEKQHVRCFGGLGVFDWGIGDPDAQNREFSAFYLAFVPRGIVNLTGAEALNDVFRVTDTVETAGKEKEEIALELRLETVGNLVQCFREDRTCYADGVGRVLARLEREPGTVSALNRELNGYYE